MTSRDNSRYQKGLWAEWLCRLMLTLKGYRILAFRYKSKFGEVDILAARGKILVAVEVKARADTATALESITPRQRERIERGAQDFVAHHPIFQNHTLRFDVMLVTKRFFPTHIQDAWQAN